MAARLTDKQRQFINEYLIDLNATQAALRAGYSEKTAYSIGNENLKKPEIQEYIQKRLKEKEDALIAKQDEVLKTLTAVMRREKPETCKARKSHYDDKGKKVTDEAEQPICVEIPTKVSDVNKAAEMLGKYYALFTEKLNVDGDMDYSIKIDYGGGDE